jgi:ComF family protein
MAMQELLELLYPPRCLGCQLPGCQICPSCESELESYLKVPIVAGAPLYSALHYNEASSHLVLAAKESNDRAAARYLASLMAMRFARLHREIGAESYLLAPIPSSRAADFRRGFAHMQVLAKLVAQSIHSEYHLPCNVAPLLIPTRKVSDQSALNAHERALNMNQAFTVNPKIRIPRSGAGIIVVDDLVTTGSTVAEAIRALKVANFEPVAVLSACVAGRFLMNKISR